MGNVARDNKNGSNMSCNGGRGNTREALADSRKDCEKVLVAGGPGPINMEADARGLCPGVDVYRLKKKKDF